MPIIFWAIACLPLLSADFVADAVPKLKIIDTLGNFVGLLAGFFIASLAAVATFGGSGMDEEMPGPVVLGHTRNAVRYSENLSRRRFLSFLFGYLALLSLVLYVLGVAFGVGYPYLVLVQFKDYAAVAFKLFWMLYAFLLSNVLANTLLGLFYLTDRMHRPNGGVRYGNGKVGRSGPNPTPEPAE
ncbi:MAG: hypothetical protein EOR60_26105 [Mesorhizobium sp.]|nr:MAG: hypothetical protein EOR60_26105 [Mesorhizobium sp.]